MPSLGSAQSFRGKHEGEKIVLVGSAPSLNDVDLAPLAGMFTTIGSNRILMKDGFKPTYLVLCDRTPYGVEYRSGRVHKYVEGGGIVLASNTIWDPGIKSRGVGVFPEPDFNYYYWRVGSCSTPISFTDLGKPICSFGTIIGPMIQIAAVFGAKEIGVVGVDLMAPLTAKSIHFYSQEEAKEGRRAEGVYRGDGTSLASLRTIETLRQARDMSQDYGFEILNLSPVTDGPFADVFGNTSIEDFMGG